MTIDSLPAHAVTNAGPSIIPLLVSAAAIGAAVVASMQRAAEIASLRAELGELRERATQAASPAGRAPARRTGPMFQALYQEQPDLLERLGASGPLLATCAAALLGLASGGLLWWDVARHRQAPAVAPAELALVQQTQDSLGALVSKLQDSLRLVAAAATEAAPRPSAPASAAAARAGRKTTTTAAIPSVLPPPKFSPTGLGAGAQAAPVADSSRHRTP
jgi:hypothetical protein